MVWWKYVTIDWKSYSYNGRAGKEDSMDESCSNKSVPKCAQKIRSAEVTTANRSFIGPVAKLAIIKDEVISSKICPA